MALSNDGGSYLLFQKMVGDGAGFSSPYQRIGMRAKLWDFGTSHLFGETHFVITDHSRVGVNVGGGYRWLANGGVLGVNGWYDSIETDYGNRFQTVGFGFEALHRDTDLRGNVYIPVGEDEGFVRLLDLGTQPVFTQNIFGTLGTGLFERNTTAFDLEAGTAVPGIDWLRMYAGPYFMATSGEDDTWGVRARAEARFSRDINLNFIVTEDDSFGTNLNLGIEVKFSGGLPTRIAAVTNPYDRRYDQVRRQWAGQVRQIRRKVPVPLLDPRDGQPLNIVWVDNTNGAPGSGTYEDPYQMLPGVADGADYILVRTGAGDTTGNIVLQDGQFLFGEGRQFSINTDRLGLVPIPETYFANSGPRPTLVGADPAQNVITLANNNFVSNFDIFGGTAAAIGGNGINNFHLEYITGTAADGINIANYTGLGVLRNSQFYPSAGGRGVFISNTGGGLLDIDDVTTDGGAIGMHLVAQDDPFGVTINNYTGDNHTDSGLVLEAMGGEMIAEVTDASIFNSTGVTGRGFGLDVSNGRLDATMQNILAEGNGNLFEGNVTNGILNASVTNATLAGSTGGSGAVLNLSNATGVTTFDTIDASGNAVDGIRAVADNGSNYGLNVLDSNVSGNVDDNIQTDAFGGSTLATFVDPTDASGAVTGNGYEFSVDGGSLLTARFLEVDLSGNNSNAILGRVEGGSSAQLDFDIFDASQSVTGAGVNLFVNNGSTVVGTFNDGTFDNNATTNVLASALSGSSIDLTFDNVTADGGATLGGYIVNAIDGSTIVSSWSNGSISNTNADGVSANVAGPAANSGIDLAFDNVTIDGNAGHGIDGLVNGDAQDAILNIALANSSVSGNTGDGLRLDLTGNGSVTQVDIAGTPMTNNGDDGVEFSVANGATLDFDATNGGTDLSDNGAGSGSGSAINGYVTGAGSTAMLNLNGVNADRSAGNGAQFIVDLDGKLEFNYANGSISNSGGTGIASTVAGGATASYDISNTSLNNNAGTVGGLGDGFQVIADDGSTVVASFNEVSANDNARNGFLFIANNSSAINVDFSNNTATAERNGENGLAFDVLLGSSFSLNLTGGSFSNNGVSGNFSGVRGQVDGAGSSADVAFDGTLVDNNTLHGFEFLVQNGGQFVGSLDSTTGTLSASENTRSGVSFQANGAGTVAALLMSGENQFNSNGQSTGADGIDADGTDVDQFVVGVAGSVNASGGDGIDIVMSNVAAGAIDIRGGGVSTIDDNLGNGINIDLTDTTLNDIMVKSTLVSGFNISGYDSISRNAGAGIIVNADNTDLNTPGAISGNTVTENGGGGILVNLENGSDWNLSVTDNSVNANTGNGIKVTADSGTHVHDVSGNTLISNTDNNIFVDYSGTAVVEMHIDDNVVDGDGGSTGDGEFTIGTNFLADSFSLLSSGEPPDTMGAVGFDYIVELVNDAYSIFDKNGNQLFSTSDEAFWANAGISLVGTDTFDPRIIFDPVSGRWFATAITRGTGNDILVAVSNTDDPFDGFTGFQFIGDVDDNLFVDFDMLGIDRDSLVITTNNFDDSDNFTDISIFNIPLADLLAPSPTIANLSRIENESVATTGYSPQPVVNINGPADDRATLLSAVYFVAGGEIIKTDLTGASSTQIVLDSANTVAGVPAFTFAPNGTQPGGFPVDSGGDRINGNVVQVGDSIWAAHAIEGSTGRSAIRWYEIDANTNAVIQTGTLEDAAADYMFPSIAVNDTGEVVIGFSLTSDSQSVSSAAVFGRTDGGTTSFSAPTILASGTGTYFGSRWGDYSATVVDPSDPDSFWTFQQIAQGTSSYGVQVTEINFVADPPITGQTVNDGILVNVRDTAVLTSDSTINGNDVSAHGNHGIHVNLADTATIANLDMIGNSSVDNAAQGILFETSGTPTLGGLNITGPGDVTGNGDTGIDVRLTNVLGTPNVTIDGMNVSDNAGAGISVVTRDTALGDVSISGNTASGNLGGQGVLLDIQNTMPMDVASITLDGNTADNNAATGIDVLLDLVNITGSFSISDSASVANNAGAGISVVGTNVDATGVTFDVSRNIVDGSTGGDGILLDLTDSTVGPLMLVANTSNNNFGDGIRTQLSNVLGTPDVTISSNFVNNNGERGVVLSADNSPLGALLFNANSITNSQGNTLDGDGLLVQLVNSSAVSLEVSESGMNGNAGDGLDLDLTGSPIGQIDIVDNSLGSMGSQIGLTFLIDGNTFGQPFSIINSSDPGLNITNFFLDIAPTGVVWDTEEPGAAIPFLPLLGSDVTTGLASINGTAVVPPIVSGPGFDETQDSVGTILPGGGVPDDGTVIDLVFSDFNPGESFTWEADVDLAGMPGSTVFGNDLIGSDIRVDFTGGLFLTGLLQPVAGNPDASTFVATGGTPTIAGGLAANGNNGIRISAEAGSDIGGLNIDNNLIDENGANGIEFLISDSTLPDGTGGNVVTITNNSITENGNDGVSLVSPDTDGAGIAMDFDNNVITGNIAGAGLNISLNNESGDFTTNITNNDISGNGAQGVSLVAETATPPASTSINIDVQDFSGNTVSDNGDMGVRIVIPNDASLALNMGASGANLVDGNVDAGVGISLTGNAIADLNISNSTFSNTTNGGSADFNGEGFMVRMVDNAVVANAQFGDVSLNNTTFSGNASHGLAFLVDGDAHLDSPTIRNVTSSDNSGDGLNFERLGNGVVDDVVITDSIITGNDDGIDVLARAANLTDEYTIMNSTITGNANRGIHLRAEADADIDAIIMGNDIANNGGDGIQTTERRNSGGDSLSVDVLVTQNTIENNGGQGIEISAFHNSVTIGSAGNPFPDNIIRGNGDDGIEINASGFESIVNNLIENNGGDAGIDLNLVGNFTSVAQNTMRGNSGDGVELSNSGGPSLVAINDNLIEQNGEDGVEIVSDTASGLTATVDNNVIQDNTGRGVAIFNRGEADANISLTGNVIQRSGEEGVYVVNTASTTQSTDAASTAAMAANGSVFADPRLVFNMTSNQVRDNGVLSGFLGTGLVMRVGTSDARTSFTDDGGFAASRGGIVADVQNNTFSGQFGADALFQSFVSTVNPATTGGTWTDMNNDPRDPADDVFNVTSFQSDPLARLDLTFIGNTMQETQATLTGASYNNSEAVFKSRTRSQDGDDPAGPFPGSPDDDGPFGSGTRARNAQRQAGRFILPPTMAAGSGFLFSGVGESTFRVNANVNAVNTLGAGTGFIFDAPVYNDPRFDANGVMSGPVSGPLDIDNMPFGWSILP